MSLENEYLSDEELNALIFEVEQNDMVMAPPELLDQILIGVENIERIPAQKKKSTHREFMQYCFRVCASVAATIVMVFIMPEFVYLETAEIPTKQEVLAGEEYATREEVLDDTSFLKKLLRNIENLSKNREISIFNEENGGK